MIPNDFPSLDFDLGETADQLRASVRGFTADEVAPLAAEIDRSNEFPRQLWTTTWYPRAAKRPTRTCGTIPARWYGLRNRTVPKAGPSGA